jgi:hypothetical protein
MKKLHTKKFKITENHQTKEKQAKMEKTMRNLKKKETRRPKILLQLIGQT